MLSPALSIRFGRACIHDSRGDERGTCLFVDAGDKRLKPTRLWDRIVVQQSDERPRASRTPCIVAAGEPTIFR